MRMVPLRRRPHYISPGRAATVGLWTRALTQKNMKRGCIFLGEELDYIFTKKCTTLNKWEQSMSPPDRRSCRTTQGTPSGRRIPPEAPTHGRRALPGAPFQRRWGPPKPAGTPPFPCEALIRLGRRFGVFCGRV